MLLSSQDPSIVNLLMSFVFFFFFSSRRRHTRFKCDWSSDVCSSDLFPDSKCGNQFGDDDRPGGGGVVDRRKQRPRPSSLCNQSSNVSQQGRPRLDEIGRASCRERV